MRNSFWSRARCALFAALAAPTLPFLSSLLIGAGPGEGAGGGSAATVRPAAVAGSWYPDHPCLISAEVDRMVRATAAAPPLAGKPVALVVPHAGWRYSGFAAVAAFRQLHPGDFDRVVIVAPSHQGAFQGFSIADVSAFRTPVGDVPLCEKAVKSLRDSRLVRSVPGVEDREHSIEIELPFLQERLDRFCLVPILAGRTDAAMQRGLAEKLAALDDGKTLFVFSSDFTHYGAGYDFVPYGASARQAKERIRELDSRALTFFSPPDAEGFRKFLDETGDSICGREGLKVMLELLPRIAPAAKAVPLARYTSIDLPGNPSDDSVTYVAMAYVSSVAPEAPPLGAPSPPSTAPPRPAPLSADLGAKLLRVARATLRTELEATDDLRRALRDLPASAGELARLQGAFVTLNRTDPAEIAREGKLRGCIGQVHPAYTIPEAVVVAAAQAALSDPRFPPVRKEELGKLELELTLLSPPRPIGSWKEIVLGRDGIVLTKGESRALFLPQVPVEEKWTLEETLSYLSRKAGLAADAWREGATFEVFEGQSFEERSGSKEGAHGGE
jgi:AmmeMemoRadiSam system protein B/AmmeMemoRadiSam system protein A